MAALLEIVAVASLVAGAASALAITVEILAGRRQAMWIMDVVWPITALWSGPFGYLAYRRWGRAGSKRAAMSAKARGEEPPSRTQPFPVLTGKAALHCGSGCTLGDILAECLAALFPLTLFGQRIFGSWLYDFVAAYTLGIAFQYFTIKPMRDLSVKQGIGAAIKADTLSLTAWQIGMYGWMAIARFAIFGHELPRSSAVFWLMMQIAMFGGFATSFPVNWWLLEKGIKEKM